MSIIKAEVVQMTHVSLETNFSVRIVSPVEMPPQTFSIGTYDVMVRSYPSWNTSKLIYELLSDKILSFYNNLVEFSPMMDMFEDPMKYEIATAVDLILIAPFKRQDKWFPLNSPLTP